VVAALLARERTGQGQHVRLSMLDAVLAFLWASDMGAQTFADAPATQQDAASFIDLIYATKDGHMTVAVMSDREWTGLCRALDRPGWLTDPRFSSPAARDRNVNERLAMTQAVLLTRTTAEWLARIEGEDVPCAPVLSRSQVIHHPQVQASESLIESDHPAAGRLRQARAAARFDRTPTELRHGAPSLGQHTAEILAEAGLTQNEIDALYASGTVAGGLPIAAE
jgi:crotonobetainyl-CoA:carnitine CoA-transferase CaiB-like acyl-CoA transferase